MDDSAHVSKYCEIRRKIQIMFDIIHKQILCIIFQDGKGTSGDESFMLNDDTDDASVR